ncbi:MAG: restriction endonuclease subunit S [Coriobacteriales bacterium]|nr:restriction endonuclease subunit S [Coriobacteriales bacterium]
MAESKTKPEIRFSGFTDAWEQRRLGELAEIVRGASPRPIKDPKWFDDESDIGWLRISDVTEQDGRVHFLEQRISKEGQEKTRVLTEPHLLLSIAATVGKPVINYVKTGVHDGFLIFLNPDFDCEFMFQWLEMFRPKWSKYGQPGSQVNLNSDLVKSKEIMLPNRQEQTQIGAFFAALDHLITLHQRECDKTVNIKKAMLEKMFPKEGENKPEIRFTGFTDAWEQRKLGDLYEVNKERNEGRFGFERTLSVATMTFNGGNGAADSSLDSYKLLRVGDIAFEGHTNKRFAYGRFVLNDAGDGLMSPRFSCLRPIAEQCFSFWKHYIHHEPIMRGILVKATKSGTMMNELVVPDFLKQPIKVPSLEEQNQIGQLFTALDHLITLHQRELVKLKNVKKSLLEKMFV